MIQATLFAGHEGEMRHDKWFYITVFAGCELVKPTLARRILVQRHRDDSVSVRRKPFFFTMFGGTSIKSPTLAAEFIDMREMLTSGAISRDEWERALVEIGREQDSFASLTLFGAFEECTLPTDEEEIDSLAIQCHLGNVTASAREILQSGIGQRESERRAIVRRAVQATT